MVHATGRGGGGAWWGEIWLENFHYLPQEKIEFFTLFLWRFSGAATIEI